MRTLRFNITGQQIRPDPACDFSGIVAGTSGYLQAQFDFSAEWNGLLKVAEFRTYGQPVPVPVRNGCCMVPAEVTGSRQWKVRVIGKHGEFRITTGEARVEQEVTG